MSPFSRQRHRLLSKISLEDGFSMGFSFSVHLAIGGLAAFVLDYLFKDLCIETTLEDMVCIRHVFANSNGFGYPNFRILSVIQPILIVNITWPPSCYLVKIGAQRTSKNNSDTCVS